MNALQTPRSPGGFAFEGGLRGSPITHDEMNSLLEPLRSTLLRIEKALLDDPFVLPSAEMPVQDALVQDIFGHSYGQDTTQDNNGSLTTGSDSMVGQISKERRTPRLSSQATCGVDDIEAEDADGGRRGHVKEMTEHLDIAKVLNQEGLQAEITVVERVGLRLEKSARWWAGLEEPERDTILFKVVTSNPFEQLCMCIIVFNSALVAATSDWMIKHEDADAPVAFEVMEKACFFWFVLELFLRISAHRGHFFVNDDMNWNIFDCILVTISLVDFTMDTIASATEHGAGNVAFMRTVRLLKLARIFRSLRAFRFFRSLVLLLDSFQRSFVSLFWGLVMLAFVLYLFTLLFMQACIDYLTENELDDRAVRQIKSYFGSFGRTWLSLYMSVTGGDDWGNLYSIVVKSGLGYGILLVFFTFFFLFALFNILTGTLVEKAMTTSKPDRTEVILHQRKSIAEDKGQFLRLCKAMDADGDGVISWQEFEEWMCNPVMLGYMASIGVEIYDVELFFNTVAARQGRDGKVVGEGEVTIEHFVEGCLQMRGTATALDMQRLLFENHVIHHDLKHVMEVSNSFAKKFDYLEHTCARMLGHLCRTSSHVGQPSANMGDVSSLEQTLRGLENARTMVRQLYTGMEDRHDQALFNIDI